MHGEGVFTWLDGKKYTGGYQNDKREGYGIFDYPDGKRYSGFWKNSK